jgi:Holliday junction resolvase RusA-like endonuclease
VTYRLSFELPGLPRMANPSGRSQHWRAVFGERRKWKTAVWAAVQGKLPRQPLERYTLHLTRFSSVPPDFDGLVSSWKAIVDGLREAKVIADDKLVNTGPWRCHWIKCKRDEGRVSVTVEDRSDIEAGVQL